MAKRGREGDRRRRSRFGDVVESAIEDLKADIAARGRDGRLPPRVSALFLEAIDEVAVVVADAPDRRQREENERPEELLGLYEGVPRIEWAADEALIPARITIFRRAIEDLAPTPAEQREEVRRTVKHEIAHHLGYDDEKLDRLGLGDAE